MDLPAPRRRLAIRIAKALALAVAGYALSPIDLIPDFIPLVGYLDDVILVPAGIWLVIRLIPAEVLAEHRALADAASSRPVNGTATAAIVAIWIVAACTLVWLSRHYLFEAHD